MRLNAVLNNHYYPFLDSASDAELQDSATDSPNTSPRKSGRTPARNKFIDEDWVTDSPSKGRGRGRVNLNTMMSNPFSLR